MTASESLTRRKMRRTRLAIADAAMRLFTERGFDQVTVSEIAAAAEVAEKTVYNHFRTKAELVFDADRDAIAALLAAVRVRPAGQPALTAIRECLARLAEEFGEGAPPAAQAAFRQLVAGSLALQAHQREMAARHERALAELLAEETGAEPGSPEPYMAAFAFIGAVRAGYETAHRGGRAGATNRALDLLETGLAGYAIKPDPANRDTQRAAAEDPTSRRQAPQQRSP